MTVPNLARVQVIAQLAASSFSNHLARPPGIAVDLLPVSPRGGGA